METENSCSVPDNQLFYVVVFVVEVDQDQEPLKQCAPVYTITTLKYYNYAQTPYYMKTVPLS